MSLPFKTPPKAPAKEPIRRIAVIDVCPFCAGLHMTLAEYGACKLASPRR